MSGKKILTEIAPEKGNLDLKLGRFFKHTFQTSVFQPQYPQYHSSKKLLLRSLAPPWKRYPPYARPGRETLFGGEWRAGVQKVGIAGTGQITFGRTK